MSKTGDSPGRKAQRPDDAEQQTRVQTGSAGDKIAAKPGSKAPARTDQDPRALSDAGGDTRMFDPDEQITAEPTDSSPAPESTILKTAAAIEDARCEPTRMLEPEAAPADEATRISVSPPAPGVSRQGDANQSATGRSGGSLPVKPADNGGVEGGSIGIESTELIDLPSALTERADPDATECLGTQAAASDVTERVDASDHIDTADATRRTNAGSPRSGVSAARVATSAGGGMVNLTVGSVLRQRFRITGVLGEGGMGAVYSAVDMLKEEARDENVNVALKVMKPDIVDAELSFMGLQREARRAQQLAHPNIVTVYDFDRADGVIYMTMEFMRGKPLDAVLEDKPHGLDLEDARDITGQICKGLAYAHNEGIVHSDLKPQNVFLLDSGRAKILDFGIARAYQAKKVDMVETVFAGYSPAFASPEVINRQSPTPADDVFALGLLVYQLFTGRHPFDWQSADKAVEQGLKPKRDPAFKRAEWAAVQAALNFNRDKRPQDAAEFLKRFAPSRIRQVAVGVPLLSILAVVGWITFYQPQLGPDIPFEELPITLQQEITRNLSDAELFLNYGDLDSAFQLYDAVLTAHPGNLDATAGIHRAAESAAERISGAVRAGQISAEAGRQSLQALLAYESLPSRSRRVLSNAMERL